MLRLHNLLYQSFKCLEVSTSRYDLTTWWEEIVEESILSWWTNSQKRIFKVLFDSIPKYVSRRMPESALIGFDTFDITCVLQRSVNVNQFPFVLIWFSLRIEFIWVIDLTAWVVFCVSHFGKLIQACLISECIEGACPCVGVSKRIHCLIRLH